MDMVKHHDKNGDGALSFDEFREIPWLKDKGEDEQEDRFEEMDKNKDLKLVGDEAVGGSPFYKIEGKYARGEARTIWIDKKDFLLKKIHSSNKISGATVERTTTYRPRVDVAIPPEAFEFTPPKT